MTRGVLENNPGPVAVTGVFPDSPAERAGLKKGDRIISINGQRVEGSSTVISTVRSSAGKDVELVLERATSEQEARPGTSSYSEQSTLLISPERAVASDLSPIPDTGDAYRIGISVEPLRSEARRFNVALSIRGTNSFLKLTLKLMKSLIFPKGLAISSERQRVEVVPLNERPQNSSILSNFVTMFAFMIVSPSIFLFAINILPLPFLDGGKIVRTTVRAIRPRQVSS